MTSLRPMTWSSKAAGGERCWKRSWPEFAATSDAARGRRLLLSLPKCASRKTGDEAVEKRVVEQRERDTRDQRRRHQRLPEIDVPADQLERHPRRDRPRVGRGDERDRVNELVHAERER